jgi:hypothetical protein
MALAASSHAHQGVGDFSDFMRTRAGHKHLSQALSHLRGVSTISLEDLGVELALAVAGHVQVLEPTRGRDQVTLLIVIAIAFAEASCSLPPQTDQRVELLAHHSLSHHANGSTSECSQMLTKFLLVRHLWWRLYRR